MINAQATCEECTRIYDYNKMPAFIEGRLLCCLQCYHTAKKKKKSKYLAKRCESDGKKFPSLLERNCYNALMDLKESKDIHFFLRQVPFDLPGGSIHRVDFGIFCDNGVFFIEAKGKDLALGKLKRKQVIDLYNVDVFVVKNPGEIKLILEGEI